MKRRREKRRAIALMETPERGEKSQKGRNGSESAEGTDEVKVLRTREQEVRGGG